MGGGIWLKTGCRCEVGEVLHVGWKGEFYMWGGWGRGSTCGYGEKGRGEIFMWSWKGNLCVGWERNYSCEVGEGLYI